jgi:uncharacterized membrane protein
MLHGKKGTMVGTIIGIVVGVILIVAVAIPVTSQVIEDANLTGTTATVVGFIPLFLAIGGLVFAAMFIGGKR